LWSILRNSQAGSLCHDDFAVLLGAAQKARPEQTCSAAITDKGIDLAKEGLAGPSATWTYLISDNPFGDVLQRLLRGLKRCLAAESEADDD